MREALSLATHVLSIEKSSLGGGAALFACCGVVVDEPPSTSGVAATADPVVSAGVTCWSCEALLSAILFSSLSRLWPTRTRKIIIYEYI